MKKADFDVYFNLHKKVFSVKNRYTGRVQMHSNEVRLQDVQFKVSQAGRERVLREKRKNVHAYVRGDLWCEFTGPFEDPVEITYNPYKYETFVIKSTGEPVFSAKKVLLKDKKIFAIL